MGQKSDTRPLKLQSPVSSPHFPTGSRLGPPRSPVLGFVSPSNSGFMGSRAPGCSWTGSEGWARGVCALRSRCWNSCCCDGGRGGGAGLLRLEILRAKWRWVRTKDMAGGRRGTCRCTFSDNHHSIWFSNADLSSYPYSPSPTFVWESARQKLKSSSGVYKQETQERSGLWLLPAP